MSVGEASLRGATVTCADLAKRYGATMALRGVSLNVAPGSIHCLVGENGAGKSTCLGIISGRVVPNSGTVTLDGSGLPYGKPRAIRRMGVTAIYQELTILPALSTQANVFLGNEMATTGVLRERAMKARFMALAEEFGVNLPLGRRAGTLPIAQQQSLEILRALAGTPRVILFDEPTASFSLAERDAFYRLVRQLHSRGITMVLVTHNLDEVLSLPDTVTVFRDGSVVAEAPVADWTKQSLVREMAGSRLAATVTQVRSRRDRTPPAPSAEVLMKVDDLKVPGLIHGISFDVQAGEVVGLAGLAGAGRTTMLNAIGGLFAHAQGTLSIAGQKERMPRTCRASRRLGISLIPEDRKDSGIVAALASADNVVLSRLGAVSSLGILNRRRTLAAARVASEPFDLADDRLPLPARALSGGNQQKLLFARSSFAQPKILLADEPTRGIDTNAKAEILKSVRALAAAGMGVLVASSELEEVLEMSDRVLVISGGRVVAEHAVTDSLTPETLLRDAFHVEGVA